MDAVPSIPTSFPEKLFSKGISDLVSVIPPGAQLSPYSKIPAALLGKIPGRKGHDGRWAGFNWRQHAATIDDVRQWHNDGANVGLLADRFPGIDIDCGDEHVADTIANLALEKLGAAPIRVGKFPKRLLMYRTTETFGRLRLWFKPKDSTAAESKNEYLVEILGRGQQYLVHGTHPIGRKYEWLQDPTEQPLTEITSEQAGKFLDALESHLHEQGFETRREGDARSGTASAQAASVNQESLLAPSFDALRDAVAAIPNDNDRFPSRTDYLRMGYAIKAAAGDAREDDAFELFADWAARWDGEVNDPETVCSDWLRMNGAKTVGWGLIASIARTYGFNDAQYEFTASEPTPTRDRDVVVQPIEYSDQWLAKRIAKRHADAIRFVPQKDQFLLWDQARWKPDDLLSAEDIIKRELAIVADQVARMGATDEEKKAWWRLAKSMCSAAKVVAVRTLLTSERTMAINLDQLDKDPWILNTPGGTVDFVRGELRASDPRDLCTRSTSASPDFSAECPVWVKFLQETTGDDPELQGYLQRLAGYCLTGSTREQQLTFVWGPGGNGKGVFLNTITGILGDYARTAAMETFTASGSERHPTDMAMLAGARLVAASETPANKTWDEARLKSLTGGDPITARFMRQDFFTYMPMFKLVLVGNHKPALRTVEDAIRRRLHIVPFTNRPKQVDPNLSETLKAEWPGILAWMIRGCVLWQARGLQPPAAVLAATNEYLADQDMLGRWIQEACELSEQCWTPLQELFDSYRNWAGGFGESAGIQRGFGELLTNHGFRRRLHSRTRRVEFEGIQARSQTGEEELLPTDETPAAVNA